MKSTDPVLAAAQRIASGEPVDTQSLADPKLARGLLRVAQIGRALAGDQSVGATWGHLQRLQRMDHGSFGEVFRAWDPTLDRYVALKLKRMDAPSGLLSGRDFVAEAKRLARVRHPHVLAVHGASFHQDRAGLWADWIDGETLQARLQREGPLPLEALQQFAAELASALQAVHAAGIVHADIKAGNVMLDRHGHAVLMDFGAGFSCDDEPTRLTAGTPRYLAPEAARGEPVTAAIDLYALGVLLFRAASGGFPGEGRLPAQLGRDWRRLIDDLLATDPRARPSASALCARIARLQRAPLQRARRSARWLLVVGLTAISMVSSVGYWRAQEAKQSAEAAQRRAERVSDFLRELLGLASQASLGPHASLRQLLDVAPGLAEHRIELSALDRADLLSALAGLEGDLGNDEKAAQLAQSAAELAESTAPQSEAASRLAADALRWRAMAGDAEIAVHEVEALLQRLQRTDASPSLLAFVAFCLAEAEVRLSLQRSTPQLLARIEARIAHVLSDPELLDAATESIALRRLATLRMEADDFPAAQRIAAQGVARSVQRLGEAHPLTALARRVYGWSLVNKDPSPLAIRQFEANLRLHEVKLGVDSPPMIDDRIGLAYALLVAHRQAEAEAMASSAWQAANRVFGRDHRSTIDAGLTWSQALLSAQKWQSAADLLSDLHARLQQGGRQASRQYLHVSRELAKVQERLGQQDAATRVRRDCQRFGEMALGSAHALVQRCMEANVD